MKQKKILGMKENILVVNAMAILLAALLFTNIPVIPEDGYKTTAREISFEVIGLTDKIMLDDNKDFTSPLIIHQPFKVLLEPGQYYWKAGISKVSTFTIESAVVVSTTEQEDDVKVKNVGNTEIGLSFKDSNLLTGRAILGVGESLRTKNIGKIIAEEND